MKVGQLKLCSLRSRIKNKEKSTGLIDLWTNTLRIRDQEVEQKKRKKISKINGHKHPKSEKA